MEHLGYAKPSKFWIKLAPVLLKCLKSPTSASQRFYLCLCPFSWQGRRYTLIHPLMFLRGPTWNGLFLWVKFTCVWLKIRIVLDFLVNLGEALKSTRTWGISHLVSLNQHVCWVSQASFLASPNSTDQNDLPLQWILWDPVGSQRLCHQVGNVSYVYPQKKCW